jgi:hypothetical protein
MKKFGRVVITFLLAAAASAQGGDFDGSKRLICAPIEANDCSAGEACERSTPQQVGAPAFLRIDFEKKAVVGPERSSPIQVMEKTEAQLLLMGTEMGMGWTIVLDQADGSMAATLANREGAFVFFGTCTSP